MRSLLLLVCSTMLIFSPLVPWSFGRMLFAGSFPLSLPRSFSLPFFLSPPRQSRDQDKVDVPLPLLAFDPDQKLDPFGQRQTRSVIRKQREKQTHIQEFFSSKLTSSQEKSNGEKTPKLITGKRKGRLDLEDEEGNTTRTKNQKLEAKVTEPDASQEQAESATTDPKG